MLFSYNLLSTLVDLSAFTPATLRSRLTFAGFEVEGMEKVAEASNLIIGQVLTCEKHPDSDHLHVLTVDCGKEEGIKDIVCGAPNVRKDLKVIVALPGCVLPALGETIKRGVIRGKESDGMCCSLLELGVKKDTLPLNSPSLNGIEELPSDAPIGERNVLAYLGLDDSVLDVNVLPNRPDCLSYIGLAREISSLTGAKLKEIPVFKNEYSDHLTVKSETPHCPRFDALKIVSVVPKKETPLKIRRALEASGIRSLDPIVDLGNYAMLLTGQPFNMYDADKNPSDTYVVKEDYQGEMETFDGKKLSLIPGDLVVTDGSKPICLAGIMADKEQAVTSETKNIVVEAADFYHANIRHTSARLGLASASSQLFAKGRNPRMIDEAMAVIISLLPEFFASYKVTDYASYKGDIVENKPFEFSYDALNKRLGSSYTKEEIDTVIKAYRLSFVDGNKLLAPIDRVDLNEQCDIDEEVFRFYPADKITPSLEGFPLTHGSLTYAQKEKREIRELLIARGFSEILSFTLVDEKMDSELRVFSNEPSYRVKNPMTKDHEFVRSDLLSSMLATVHYNVSHQHEDLALFEISDMDTPKGNHLYLSLALRGEKMTAEKYGAQPYDFFDMKGVIEAIFARLGIPSTRYKLSYSKNPYFHPGASADIRMGKDLVGTFGQLHPSYEKDKVFLAELDLGYLLGLKSSKTKFVPFSSYPLVRRDLSFEMNGKVTYEELKKEILHVKNSYVQEVYYFDDFTDKETGKEYLGVSLLLGKEDGTLKDKEINASLEAVKTTVRERLGLKLRGE